MCDYVTTHILLLTVTSQNGFIHSAKGEKRRNVSVVFS